MQFRSFWVSYILTSWLGLLSDYAIDVFNIKWEQPVFQTYKPSGRCGFLTIPLIFLAIGATIPLAFVYQLVLNFIPIIYVNFLATMGMGYALARIGIFVVQSGKVRNLLVTGALAVTLVFSALGAKFFFQYRAMLDEFTTQVMQSEKIEDSHREEVRAELAKELTFVKHIQLRTENGWNLGRGGQNGAPVNGLFVYLVWIIEAGVVLYFCVPKTYASAGLPFSEKLNAWASELNAVMVLPVTSEEMVSKIRAAASVDELLEIPIPKTDQSNQFAIYKVNSIAGQEMEDAYLSVSLLTLSVNNKGEQVRAEAPLVQNAVLSRQQREQLVENAQLLKEAIAEFRQAADAEAERQPSNPQPDSEVT